MRGLCRSMGLWTLAITAIACQGKKPTAPVAQVEEGRFRHDLHLPPAMSWSGKSLAAVCVECHAPKPGGSASLLRPGATQHAPCDRGQCHAAEFRKRPGKLCLICHEDSDAALPTKLAAYPPTTGRRYLASSFSHDKHLDFERMEQAVGFHVSCSDCHRADSSGNPQRPSHETCTRCHAREAVAEDTPAMRSCARCHQQRPAPPTRSRKLIVGDLRFSHGPHRRDRKGKPILCAECHRDTASVEATGTHASPPTDSCVACHDDGNRAPASAAMKVCETCHAGKSASLGAIPPRSHLPAEEMPANHTLAFREDHEREARRSPQDCARCHSFMSGARRDTCDQCHQVMRPRSHTAGWTEFEHGPAAAVEQDSCSTCHAADMCIACHSRPPRSHRPLMSFSRSHGVAASINPRACLTCHDPSTGFCSGPGCHSPAATGLPR